MFSYYKPIGVSYLSHGHTSETFVEFIPREINCSNGIAQAQASTSTQQLSGNVPKKLHSSTGVVHDKNLCAWCMKGSQKRTIVANLNFCCCQQKTYRTGSNCVQFVK